MVVLIILVVALAILSSILTASLIKSRKRPKSPQPLAEDEHLKELDAKRIRLEDLIKHLERSIQDKETQYAN